MRTGWLRRVRPSELWVIPTYPRQVPPPAHYAPRDGISGGPRGTVSQRPCGVMPAWPFVFYLSWPAWRDRPFCDRIAQVTAEGTELEEANSWGAALRSNRRGIHHWHRRLMTRPRHKFVPSSL